MILDFDTGGGEFLLSLGHPADRTAATERYPPNVQLCRETLLPLGIDFRECGDPSAIPWPDGVFDLILNRHGSFDAGELYRLLKRGQRPRPGGAGPARHPKALPPSLPGKAEPGIPGGRVPDPPGGRGLPAYPLLRRGGLCLVRQGPPLGVPRFFGGAVLFPALCHGRGDPGEGLCPGDGPPLPDCGGKITKKGGRAYETV